MVKNRLKSIDINQNWSILIGFRKCRIIEAPIWTFKSELLCNRQPNSWEFDFKLSTIRLGNPNGLSLHFTNKLQNAS